MAAQQTAMLDMRDANPTIIRLPFDPTKVTSRCIVTYRVHAHKLAGEEMTSDLVNLSCLC